MGPDPDIQPELKSLKFVFEFQKLEGGGRKQRRRLVTSGGVASGQETWAASLRLGLDFLVVPAAYTMLGCLGCQFSAPTHSLDGNVCQCISDLAWLSTSLIW